MPQTINHTRHFLVLISVAVYDAVHASAPAECFFTNIQMIIENAIGQWILVLCTIYAIFNHVHV